MKNLTKRLLYKGDNVARANVVWNIAGSFVYAFASMVLSFLVIRMAGEEKGGIFSRSQTEKVSILLGNTGNIEI